MKLLLTHAYFLKEDPREQRIMKPYAPLGILYLSAYLETNHVPHDLFDSTFSSPDILFNQLKKEQYDIVGIYTNLMTKLNVLKLIRWIREEPRLKNTKIILGGPEVRNHIEKFLTHGADLLVIGEGEETFYRIVSHYQSTGQLPNNEPGTAVIVNGKTQQNPERALIKDINILPAPNRKKIDLRLYLNAWKKAHGYSAVSVSTMRGCPYTCKWCSRAVYGGTYRRRSPALVIAELEAIYKEYQPDRIWFVDDVFTIHHQWLRKFAEEIKKKGLKISYEIITRADRMNEEVIQLLKESGCYKIWIGAESGSQKIIDAMDRRVDVMKVREMIQLSQQHGIKAGTFIMLGYPGETISDIKKTMEHLVVSNPDEYTVTIAYPITGTPLYHEIQNKIITSLNWAESTDREIDFKRTHSRKFYEYAIRWLDNQVKARHEKRVFKKTIRYSKGFLARVLMTIYQ